jgi:thiol:disulfide interchange protein
MSQSRTTGRMAIIIPIVILLLAWFVIVGAPKLTGSKSAPAAAGSNTHGALFQSISFDEARAASERDQKYLLVDATASWCPPCKMMEKDTWPDPRIAEWVSQRGSAIQVDVDADRPAAKALNIEAMPTMILFKDGKEVARTMGYKDADGMLAWLNKTAG